MMQRFTIIYKLADSDWNQVFMFGRDGLATDLIYSGMELKEDKKGADVVADGPVTIEQAVHDLYILTLKPGEHIPKGTIDGISFMTEDLNLTPEGPIRLIQNNVHSSD